MKHPLNLTTYKTAAGAAKALHRWVVNECKMVGMNPDIETFIHTPEQTEANGYGKAWRVSWESGPYEWAVNLSLGVGAYNTEYPECASKKPEVILLGAANWHTEPYYSFDLMFFEDK